MATYIALVNWTEQGIRSVKESPQRFERVKQLVQQGGGAIREFYLVMGQYDLVAIIEAPNDEAYARIALAIGSGGAVRTNTLKAFTEEEYRRIIASLP